jgi:WD40 repeat protein
LRTFVGHTKEIRAITFIPASATTPELRILFSCSQDETIELWDVETFRCMNILTLPKSYQGMNITSISGLSGATQTNLMTLGAVAI